MPDCLNCTEKCPQSELAHEIAKGRMYANNNLIELVKKIEAGQLVEVVRCKECRYYYDYGVNRDYCCHRSNNGKQVFDVKFKADDFCSYGERKDGDE